MQGGYSVELGEGVNRLEQTVGGLKPGKTYELMGMFRVDPGARVRMGVEGYGGTPLQKERGPSWNGKSGRTPRGRSTAHKRSPATTLAEVHYRASSTQATVFVEKTSPGAERVCVDDMGLQLVD